MTTRPIIRSCLALLAIPILAGAWFMLEEPCSRAEPQTGATVRPAGAPRQVRPSSEDLFGKQPVPYLGFGAMSIRPDGLVLIEMESSGGIAFFMQPASLALVEENGEVRFQRPAPGQQSIYEFTADRRTDGNSCGAVYRLAGDLSLDYDEVTGQLELTVQGGRETVEAAFTFVDAQRSTEQQSADRDSSCSCSCSHPTGGSCTTGKTCPPGLTCTCTCRCGSSGTQCRCSNCVRLMIAVEAEAVLD